MFKKLLVANRGEIACRIIRAAKELGIKTAAIYSDVEPTARHVKMADEAYMIGVDPLDTYLNMHRIVDLALEIGADAIHPGYGFLAENAEFAKLCEEKGITFIGPSSEVIALMGDKARSKEVMKKCRDEDELVKNYESAYSEAEKAFGKGELLLEKFIENPKHIEYQVLGDKHGNVIHLGERDCSIQRRNQKLVEIAPSLILTPEKREYYGELVVKAAKEIGYYNAGTMEFIADEEGNLYFIEMNTRIQRIFHRMQDKCGGS